MRDILFLIFLDVSVSCGQHSAASCAECPQGHGSGWCNGDCVWVDGECHPIGQIFTFYIYNQSPHILLLLSDPGCIEIQGQSLCDDDLQTIIPPIPWVEVQNKEDCAKLCYDTTDCQTWSFHGQSATCRLKTTNFADLKPSCFDIQTDWLWGTKQCGRSKYFLESMNQMHQFNVF